jgi:hypothetical protein
MNEGAISDTETPLFFQWLIILPERIAPPLTLDLQIVTGNDRHTNMADYVRRDRMTPTELSTYGS